MHDSPSGSSTARRGWARWLGMVALAFVAPTAGAADPPLPFYIVVFQTEHEPDGRVTRFDVDSVVDPHVGPEATVQVEVPATFIAAARAAQDAHWRAHPPPPDKQGLLYTYAYFDPTEPTRGDIGMEGGGVRMPFMLHLRVNATRESTFRIPALPYVRKGTALLMAGDQFGVRLSEGGVDYVRDPDKADVVVDFWQELQGESPSEMRLTIDNRSKRRVAFTADMSVPGETHFFATDILPVDAGTIGKERWPHAIVQLRLQLTPDVPASH